MPAHTAFLSKLIGSYCILIAVIMAANKAATVRAVVALVHDAPLVFVAGLILIAAGLAMILVHNVWSGGVMPVIVTVVGWLTLGKGIAFLIVPPAAAVGVLLWGIDYARFFYVDVAIVFALGVYLAFEGFRLHRSEQA